MILTKEEFLKSMERAFDQSINPKGVFILINTEETQNIAHIGSHDMRHFPDAIGMFILNHYSDEKIKYFISVMDSLKWAFRIKKLTGFFKKIFK